MATPIWPLWSYPIGFQPSDAAADDVTIGRRMSAVKHTLVVGQVGVEIACRVPRLIDDAGDLEMDQITIQIAGSAAVAAAVTQAHGCRARLACKMAGDFLAGHAQSALESSGIDVRCTLSDTADLSPLWFSALAERGQRAGYFTRGDALPLTADDIDADEMLAGIDAVLVDGTCPSAQVHLADHAVRKGIPVIFDGNHIHDGVGTLVSLSDVLICSERLANELAPRDDLPSSLAEIQRLGPKAVIITLGASGAIGLHGDELVEQAAYPVDVVCASGAGAVFHGAFAAALLAELPFETCMGYAAAAATLSCRTMGAFAGIPPRDEVVALVRSHAEGAARG